MHLNYIFIEILYEYFYTTLYKFFKYNIYTIQIHGNNSYQNCMRLERNIHKRRSTLGHLYLS